MPFSFRRLRKAHLVAVGLIALAGITTLAVTRFGWLKTAPVAKPAAGVPAQTKVKALPLGKGYLQRQGIWPQLRSALDAYGDRLEKPGKERLTAVGTISNASTTANEKVFVGSSLNLPGIFKLVLSTTAFGETCRDTAQVVVNQSISPPVVQIFGENITCQNPVAQFTMNAQPPGAAPFWTGPNGWQSTAPR